MWIMTTSGFFSIVENRRDKHTMMVRARARKDLENLQIELRGVYDSEAVEIIKTINADYPYRVIMPRTMVIEWLARTVAGVHYDNFKRAVAQRASISRANKYGDVWGVLRAIENEDPEAREGALAYGKEEAAADAKRSRARYGR